MLTASELITDVVESEKGKPISFEYGNGFFQIEDSAVFSILELSFSEIVSGTLKVGNCSFEKNSRTGNELFVVSVSIKKFVRIAGVFAVNGSLFGKLKSEQKLVQSIKELSKMKVETEDEKKAKFSALLDVFAKNDLAWIILDQKDPGVRENAEYLESKLSEFPAPTFLLKKKLEEPEAEAMAKQEPKPKQEEAVPGVTAAASVPSVAGLGLAAADMQDGEKPVAVVPTGSLQEEPETKARRGLSSSVKEGLVVLAFNLVFVFLAVLCSFLTIESFSGNDVVKGVIVALVLIISILMYLYNISFVTRMSPIVPEKDFKLFQSIISIVSIIAAVISSLVLYLFGENEILYSIENALPASYIFSISLAFVLIVLPFFSEAIAILFFEIRKIFSRKD